MKAQLPATALHLGVLTVIVLTCTNTMVYISTMGYTVLSLASLQRAQSTPMHTHPHLHRHCFLLVGVNGPCKAKVAYFDSTVAVNQNVARLEVPVDDPCCVQVLNPWGGRCGGGSSRITDHKTVTSKNRDTKDDNDISTTHWPDAIQLPVGHHTLQLEWEAMHTYTHL